MSNVEEINFSIIIPIYNSEKYIEKTVQSLLNQTYSKFEILLINDGSKDKSNLICEKIAKKDSRIKFFDRENKGVSNTRNFGIEKSRYEFLCFLDADDYVESNMLQEYVNIIKKHKNVELITSGFFSEVLDKSNIKKSQVDIINYKENYYDSKDRIKKDFIKLWDNAIFYNVWNKVYLSSIIKRYNIKFINAKMGEDLDFNQQYLLKITNIYNTEKCFYHYIRGRNNTITGKYIENLFDIRLEENFKLKNYFEKFGLKKDDFEEFCARRYIERTLGCIENLFNSQCNMSIKEKYKEIKRIILNKVTREDLKKMKAKSIKIKLLLIPYKIKSVTLAFVMGKVLAVCKRKMPKLFNSLKNKR